MLEAARELLAGEEAYVVGGTVRDELLGRPLMDLDIACREPEPAARAYARAADGAPFPLSVTHGGWRVALEGGRTVDFTPLRGSIEDDLATRDFTINAIARPLAGGCATVDPFGGRADLEAGLVRAVDAGVFQRDPLRLLRAVRFEEELGFAFERRTERLIREQAQHVTRPAGERILEVLLRLGVAGWHRLGELGLLQPLGGSLDLADRADAVDSPEYRLVVFLQDSLGLLPVSRELRRYAIALTRSAPPAGSSSRDLSRFRRRTEPWAREALAFHGRLDLADTLEASRAADPAEPLLRGDELGLPPGPEIGKLLELVAEERAAGTITTREEALELVRRHAR